MMKRLGYIASLMAGLSLWLAASASAAPVGLIRVEGAIGPATASYIARALDAAAAQNDQCLIIQLDTPGGLVASTEQIVRKIYEAQVPTVVYVAPPPAHAASAGVFITLAADVAAMAPHTRIGAAHPVEMGITGTGTTEKTDDVMKTKVENDIAAFVKSIAEKRGRNAAWAENAVRESVSITSEEALKANVIDLIADDVPDLLRQLDGRKINGRILATRAASVVEIPRTATESVFQLFWRPEVMFLLLLIAMYGIIGEMSHPGAILPGVAGAIALLLLLYMWSILPVNFAGLALIGLAVGLFIMDIFAPTHGVLTGGGIVAFFIGALMLFNHAGPGFKLPWYWIAPATLVTAAFFVFIAGAGLRAQFQPARTGREAMAGKPARALSAIDTAGGKVFFEGEIWNAVSAEPVAAQAEVEVLGINGLTLQVKPKKPNEK